MHTGTESLEHLQNASPSGTSFFFTAALSRFARASSSPATKPRNQRRAKKPAEHPAAQQQRPQQQPTSTLNVFLFPPAGRPWLAISSALVVLRFQRCSATALCYQYAVLLCVVRSVCWGWRFLVPYLKLPQRGSWVQKFYYPYLGADQLLNGKEQNWRPSPNFCFLTCFGLQWIETGLSSACAETLAAKCYVLGLLPQARP